MIVDTGTATETSFPIFPQDNNASPVNYNPRPGADLPNYRFSDISSPEYIGTFVAPLLFTSPSPSFIFITKFTIITIDTSNKGYN